MLYRTVRHAILTYWPAVCYVTLTTASLHSKGINIMRIIYLLFFAAFMFSYVVSFVHMGCWIHVIAKI
jgi:hypothetical protein